MPGTRSSRRSSSRSASSSHAFASAGLAPAVGWLRGRFPGLPIVGEPFLIIDTDAFGNALVDALKVRKRSHVTLFEMLGRDRQELVDALLVAEQERRIHIAPSDHGGAMRRALLGYRRQVGDDGVVVGGELLVALALAAVTRRHGVPRIF